MTTKQKASSGKSSTAGLGIDVKDLKVHYDTPDGVVKAVDGVSFSLRQGERMALVGESGSGKSTLAMALMRLTRAPGRIAGGQVIIDGQDMLDLDEEEMRLQRLNEVALTSSTFSSARGIQIQCKNAVNEAIRYINQKEFQYPFNHSTKSQTLTAGTFKYSVPSDAKTLDYNTYRIVKDSDLGTSGGRLRVLNYNDYLNSYITQEDEIMPTVLEVQKQDNLSATATDTLKLEQNKELPSLDSAKPTPEPEQSQSEPQKQESF